MAESMSVHVPDDITYDHEGESLTLPKGRYRPEGIGVSDLPHPTAPATTWMFDVSESAGRPARLPVRADLLDQWIRARQIVIEPD